MNFFIQSLNLDTAKISARDDAQNLSFIYHWHVAEPAVGHSPQRIDSEVLGSSSNGVRGHDLEQERFWSVMSLSKCAHGISAREDTAQMLLVVSD